MDARRGSSGGEAASTGSLGGLRVSTGTGSRGSGLGLRAWIWTVGGGAASAGGRASGGGFRAATLGGRGGAVAIGLDGAAVRRLIAAATWALRLSQPSGTS